MIHFIWSFFFLTLVCSQNVEVNEKESEVKSVEIIKNASITKIDTPAILTKNIVIPESSNHVEPAKEPPHGDAGSLTNPIMSEKYYAYDDKNAFKYNYAVLTICSLSVIAVIIYKTHRMKGSRAEIRYGTKAIDPSERQNLRTTEQQVPSWLDDSSDDDDEDKLFDINLLKNSRSNLQHV